MSDAKMRAVRRRQNSIHLDDLAVPKPGVVDVVVEVGACSLSDADVTIRQPKGQRKPPILGREAAGTIVEVGPEVADWRPGDRVAITPLRPCGLCRYCAAGRDNLCVDNMQAGVTLDGALASHVRVAPTALVPVPTGVSLEQAALLTDTVAAPYHALKRAGVHEGGSTVVVGLGGLGMHAVQIARLAGASVIGIDPDPLAREQALDLGAEEVFDVAGALEAVRAATDYGADRVLEFASTPQAADLAVACLAPGGRAVLGGFTRVNVERTLSHQALAQLTLSEGEVVGTFGATLQDLGELFDLVDDGRLDLSHSVGATIDLDQAAQLLSDRSVPSGPRSVVTTFA